LVRTKSGARCGAGTRLGLPPLWVKSAVSRTIYLADSGQSSSPGAILDPQHGRARGILDLLEDDTFQPELAEQGKRDPLQITPREKLHPSPAQDEVFDLLAALPSGALELGGIMLGLRVAEAKISDEAPGTWDFEDARNAIGIED
jgi:hypothetical protein